MNEDYQTLNDGCDGDSAGLREALGDNYKVLYENYDSMGWGHHSANALFETANGRYIHANCGGCSCGGSGDWDYESDEEHARRMIPSEEYSVSGEKRGAVNRNAEPFKPGDTAIRHVRLGRGDSREDWWEATRRLRRPNQLDLLEG